MNISRRDVAQKWLDGQIKGRACPSETVLLEETYSDNEYEVYYWDDGTKAAIDGGLM